MFFIPVSRPTDIIKLHRGKVSALGMANRQRAQYLPSLVLHLQGFLGGIRGEGSDAPDMICHMATPAEGDGLRAYFAVVAIVMVLINKPV